MLDIIYAAFPSTTFLLQLCTEQEARCCLGIRTEESHTSEDVFFAYEADIITPCRKCGKVIRESGFRENEIIRLLVTTQNPGASQAPCSTAVLQLIRQFSSSCVIPCRSICRASGRWHPFPLCFFWSSGISPSLHSISPICTNCLTGMFSEQTTSRKMDSDSPHKNGAWNISKPHISEGFKSSFLLNPLVTYLG